MESSKTLLDFIAKIPEMMGRCGVDARELKFVSDIRAVVVEWDKYKDLEEQGLLLKLPCKVGDAIYVDSKTIPTENMDFEGVKDIPLYFKAIVVSFRKNSNGTYIKLKVKAKWLHEWIDPECGPDSSYYEVDKYFTYPLSAIGKTIFLTQAEAEEALKRMEKED